MVKAEQLCTPKPDSPDPNDPTLFYLPRKAKWSSDSERTRLKTEKDFRLFSPLTVPHSLQEKVTTIGVTVTCVF